MARNRLRYSAALMAWAFASCSGYASSPLSSGQTGVRLTHSTSTQNLYVGNSGKTVEVFAPGQTSPLRTISDKIVNPAALAFDSSQNLYVANYNTRRVGVYPPNAQSPSNEITSHVGYPNSLAFDESGRLYVSNHNRRSVSVYEGSTYKPLYLIHGDYPEQIAVDKSGFLYVSFVYGDNPSYVAVYSKDSKLVDYTVGGDEGALVLALDENGNLYTGNRTASTIVEYKVHTTIVMRTIRNGVSTPTALALDGQKNLYCACGSGTVTVYAPGTVKPALTITNGVDDPEALALDSAGDLFVANQGNNSVTMYPPGSTTPSETITDGIFYPMSLAFGP
jgi:sugar lactone lactonase YvrE